MHKDLLGRQIQVGDVIAYGGRRGSYGYLHAGVVTGFTEKCVLLTCYAETWQGWKVYKSRSTEESRRIITGLTERYLMEWTGVNAHMKSTGSLAVTPEELEMLP